ncbi:MAG: hypothetical protein WBA57_00125 [Elainellaceae cyanobacterium]
MSFCPMTPQQPPKANDSDKEMRLVLIFNASPEMKQVLRRGWVILSHLITATLTAWAVQQPINTNALPERLTEVPTEMAPAESLTNAAQNEAEF